MKTNFKKWPMESESTRMPRAPMRDGASQATIDTFRLAPDGFGLMLETPLVVVPVSQAFSGIAYLRRLAFHRRRVMKELARSKILERREGRQAEYRNVKTPALPGRMKYADLRIVSCARCSRTLLGESQEPLRAAAIARGNRTAANFPPPVAARLHGDRPYCATCATHYEAGGD